MSKRYLDLVMLGDGDYLAMSCGSKFMLLHNYSLTFVDADISHNGAKLDLKARGTRAQIDFKHPDEMQLLSKITVPELLTLVREYLNQKEKAHAEQAETKEIPAVAGADQIAGGPAERADGEA